MSAIKIDLWRREPPQKISGWCTHKSRSDNENKKKIDRAEKKIQPFHGGLRTDRRNLFRGKDADRDRLKLDGGSTQCTEFEWKYIVEIDWIIFRGDVFNLS